MVILMRIGGILGALLMGGQAVAGGALGANFSADMIQNTPQQPPMQGRMFVGDGRIRTEISAQGRHSVQIVDPTAGKMWMLLPQEKLYMEMPIPASAMTGVARETNPCEGVPDMSCRRAGEETLNGRAAVKWQVTANRDGRSLRGAIWTDAEHGFPVKEQVEGRVVTELRFLGQETIDGRLTEKWAAAMNASDQSMQAMQWYDPELKIALRQDVPGGYTRELRNVRIGKQPDTLFQIPADYHKVDGPVPGATAPR